ncbi:MAG: hypothetical protein R2829_12895 [Bacteroidia bacterium]
MDTPDILHAILLRPMILKVAHGAEMVKELCILPIPAIANAIYDAVGVRITSLPISAEDVLKKIKEKNLNPEKITV